MALSMRPLAPRPPNPHPAMGNEEGAAAQHHNKVAAPRPCARGNASENLVSSTYSTVSDTIVRWPKTLQLCRVRTQPRPDRA